VPRFRHKPIVIEAFRYFRRTSIPLGVYFRDDGTPFVKTLEGDLHVSEGDWIITGLRGGHYPCKPHIFEENYKKVEE